MKRECEFCFGVGTIKFGTPTRSGKIYWRRIPCDHARDPLFDVHRGAA